MHKFPGLPSPRTLATHAFVLLVCAGFISMGHTQVAKACWVHIPLEKIVATSPVVVVGTIETIERAKSPPAHSRGYDIAKIRVERVLKNQTNSPQKIEMIHMAMPSVNSPVRMSTDLIYQQGQQGIWILAPSKRTGAGPNLFEATYPSDYQPLDQLKKVQKIIQQQSSTSPYKHKEKH